MTAHRNVLTRYLLTLATEILKIDVIFYQKWFFSQIEDLKSYNQVAYFF